MLGWIIVVGAIIGLAGIYLVRLEETKKREKMKVKLDHNEPQNVGRTGIDPNSWKRRHLDYKAINDAFNKADTFYSKNDLEQAQKAFIYVLSLHPDHIDANNKLGLIYIKKNMPNKAEAVFKHLIELEPKNPIFYGNLALAHYNQGALFEAKEAYEWAISLDSKKVSRYISLGQVCVDIKDYKAAIKAYSKAIELTPKETELYFIVTDLLVKITAYDEALAFMDALLEMHPYNQDAKDRIREIKLLKGASPLTNQGKPIENNNPLKKDQQQLF